MANLHMILLISVITFFSSNVKAQNGWTLISKPGKDVFISTEDVAYSYYTEPLGSHGFIYTILKSTNGCQSFSPVYIKPYTDFGCYLLDNLYFVNSELGYLSELCQGNASIKKTIDGGHTWDHTDYWGGRSGMSLCFLNDSLGYYSYLEPSTQFSYLKRNGEELLATRKYIFANEHNEYPGYKTVIKFVNDSTGFVICMDSLNKAVILKSNNYGNDWSEKLVIPGKIFKDIAFVTDSVGVAIGTNGTIVRTNDQGETWITVSSNTQLTLRSLDFSTDGRGYISGDDGLLLSSVDNAITWLPVSFANTKDLMYIRVFDNNHVYVHDWDGNLYSNFSGVGISDYSLDKLSIYPNPAIDNLVVTIPSGSAYYSIRILNAQGKVLLVTNNNKIAVSMFSPGIYFMILETENGRLFRQKFIKE